MVVLSGAQRPAEKDLLDRGKKAEMQRGVKRGGTEQQGKVVGTLQTMEVLNLKKTKSRKCSLAVKENEIGGEDRGNGNWLQ
ncbi:hypothetical protein CesoFtcFv8_003755 [Champsocephalus esox]|nr:hypothetical protein CesoFtcFv8_003755 [Champsocephalus esox]